MSNRIGITEAGDAGIHFEWENEMDFIGFAILITKSINDTFIEKVLKYKDKIIIHATVTGMGKTIFEPNVETAEWSKSQIEKLINLGFPANQIVLRLDPIIPTNEGLKTAENVLKLFSDTGIKRCRISFMDIYPHVKTRFEEKNIEIPYDFNPTKQMINNAKALFDKYKNIYEFEACAEYVDYKVGCISQKDANILNKKILFMGKSGQRPGCMCPMNKTELLDHKHPCKHNCLYCYWRD